MGFFACKFQDYADRRYQEREATCCVCESEPPRIGDGIVAASDRRQCTGSKLSARAGGGDVRRTEPEYGLRFEPDEEYVLELIDRIDGMSLRGVILCDRCSEKHPGKVV